MGGLRDLKEICLLIEIFQHLLFCYIFLISYVSLLSEGEEDVRWDMGIWDMETVGFSWKLKNLRFCFTFSDLRQALRRPRRFQDGWNLVLLSSHGAHLLAPLQFTSMVSS